MKKYRYSILTSTRVISLSVRDTAVGQNMSIIQLLHAVNYTGSSHAVCRTSADKLLKNISLFFDKASLKMQLL
jgi:hypothetical protein